MSGPGIVRRTRVARDQVGAGSLGLIGGSTCTCHDASAAPRAANAAPQAPSQKSGGVGDLPKFVWGACHDSGKVTPSKASARAVPPMSGALRLPMSGALCWREAHNR